MAYKAIQAAGYATDPQYANKLIKLIEDNNLTRFDKEIVVDDTLLSGAVSKIILSGINLNYNNWKRIDLIKLSNVPSLLTKLGGIEQLVALGIIGQKDLWIKKQYNSAHVRALIIKYAAQL